MNGSYPRHAVRILTARFRPVRILTAKIGPVRNLAVNIRTGPLFTARIGPVLFLTARFRTVLILTAKIRPVLSLTARFWTVLILAAKKRPVLFLAARKGTECGRLRLIYRSQDPSKSCLSDIRCSVPIACISLFIYGVTRVLFSVVLKVKLWVHLIV